MKVELRQRFSISIKDGEQVEFFLQGMCSMQAPPVEGKEVRVPHGIQKLTDDNEWYEYTMSGQFIEAVEMVRIKKGVFMHSARFRCYKYDGVPTIKHINPAYHLRGVGQSFFDSCIDGTSMWFYQNNSNGFLKDYGEPHTPHRFDPAEHFFQSLIKQI